MELETRQEATITAITEHTKEHANHANVLDVACRQGQSCRASWE